MGLRSARGAALRGSAGRPEAGRSPSVCRPSTNVPAIERLPQLWLFSAVTPKQPLAAEPRGICLLSTEQYVSLFVPKSSLCLPICVEALEEESNRLLPSLT
jgi:hypothetical protein